MIRKNIGLSILLFVCLIIQAQDSPVAKKIFSITSGELKLTLMVGNDDRLYQLYFGNADIKAEIPKKLPTREWEFLPPYGNGVVTEPAIQATHADGNTSTELHYVSHKREALPDGLELTTIFLKDPAYPFHVEVYLKSYPETNVMEIWNSISHNEDGKITLYRYASASPVLKAKEYWMTQFIGNYKREASLSEEKLTEGMKILDSKLGIRATQMRIPSFMLSMNQKAEENSGEVFGASLSWPGSFQMAFDMDWNKNLRILTGMNPAGAQYHLQKGEKFTTPPIVWAYSKNGKGDISRKFHRWSTDHVIRDPQKNRPVLLNNWEATHCDFDEKKLTSLFDGAQQVGAELFLLDDGWFGNDEFSRDDDKRGLGDWQVSRKKLPNGFPHLVKEANKRGIDFGIWIEPEMVNPNSELYQQHPDWIITQPKREPILGRYQEILDLTRPEVQAFEWNVINDILHPNPDIAYVKWDCNRYVTQPGSNYLSPGEQSHLLINYNRELLKLMERFATNFPNVMAMICSGGGGRVDFGSLRYFHSFWPSDNTDPIQRVKIQWGFSHFFPASTISSHVTRMGKAKMKFAIDVALSGAFGVDLALDNATPEEREQIAEGVRIYKSTIRNLVMSGELYRLLSPYGNSTSSLSYVSQNKDQAILYIYQIEDGHVPTITLSGLAKDKNYLIREINIPDGTISRFPANGKKFSGLELMEKGIENPLSMKYESAVLELSVVN